MSDRTERGTFAPGNQVNTTHGARSLVAVKQRSAGVRSELTALIAAHCPHVTEADSPLVDLAVDTMTKLRLVADHLDQTSGGSLLTPRGRPVRSKDIYFRLIAEVRSVLRELGIGPRSRAELLGAMGLKQERAAAIAAADLQELQAKYRPAALNGHLR